MSVLAPTLLFLILTVLSANAFPKASLGLGHGIALLDHGQHHGGSKVLADSIRQVIDENAASGYQKDNNQDLVSARDGGFYKDADNALKHHENINTQSGDNFQQNHNAQGQDLHNDKSHNKKNKKSGFHNSYHKDESGSNSSYYEDDNDAGAHTVYNNERNNQGGTDSNRYLDDHHDGGQRIYNNHRDGDYGLQGTFDSQNGRVGNYDRRDKYGDALIKNEHYGHRDYDYEYPHYYRRKPYYQDIPFRRRYDDGGYRPRYDRYENNYHESAPVITIYDDPRGGRGYDSSYERGYVSQRSSPQLEYRSSTGRAVDYPAHQETEKGRYRY